MASNYQSSASWVLFKRSFFYDLKHWQIYVYRTIISAYMLLLIFIALCQAYGGGTATGLGMFTNIVWLNIFFLTVLGVTMFAPVITEEKEVNALNLLLMTGITPFALAFSKSFSKLLIGLLFILIQIPFTFLAVTLGGVSYMQIFTAYLTIISYTFLLCYLALFTSVICSSSMQSAFWAFAGSIFILFVQIPGFNISPIYRLNQVLSTGFNGDFLCLQIPYSLILSAFFFCLSVLLFDFCCRNQLEPEDNFMAFSETRAKKSVFKVTRCWKYFITWKDFNLYTGGVNGIIYRFILIAFTNSLFLGYIYFSTPLRFELELGFVLFWIGTIALAIDMIIFASRVFRREINGKTLPILMLLPIKAPQIFYMKVCAQLPAIIPALVSISLGVYALPDQLVRIESVFICLCIFLVFGLYLHLIMLFSLFFRFGAFAVAIVALGISIMFIFVPVAYIIVILAFVLSILNNSDGYPIFFSLTLLLALGVICTFVYYLIQVLIANRLRQLASDI